MHSETPKFRAWMAAEKEAQQAERELHAIMLRYAKQEGGPPPPELVASAAIQRAEAQALFEEAMAELKRLAESLHHRRLETLAPPIRHQGQHPQARQERGTDPGEAPRHPGHP